MDHVRMFQLNWLGDIINLEFTTLAAETLLFALQPAFSPAICAFDDTKLSAAFALMHIYIHLLLEDLF